MMSGAITGSSGRQASEARPFSASSGNRTKTAKSGFGEGFSPRRRAGCVALAADKQQHRHHSLEWRCCCSVAKSATEQWCFPSTPPLLSWWRCCRVALRRRALSLAKSCLGPGFVDWEGRKAHFIGIRPVHLEWTVVDGVTHWLGRLDKLG